MNVERAVPVLWLDLDGTVRGYHALRKSLAAAEVTNAPE